MVSFILFITAIMTIFSSAIDPLYARNLTRLSAVTDESEREAILSFKRYGGGTYSTAAAFMCLFPYLFTINKNIKISPFLKNSLFFFVLPSFSHLLVCDIWEYPYRCSV